MSVSIKLKQDTFRVREACDIELEINAGTGFSSGDRIEIMPPNSWLLLSGPSHPRPLQTENTGEPHYIEVFSQSNAVFDVSIAPCNQYYEQGMIRHGKKITAILKSGCVAAGETVTFAYRNTFAPYISDHAEIIVKVNGESPEYVPMLTTLPGPAESVRIIVPSVARPDKEFKVLVVSLDKFENCSSSEYKNQTLYDNEEQVIADNLDFTGSVAVPVRINREGVYRFKMNDTVSNAVKISPDAPIPYWGDIHIHTKFSHDGQGENPYPYAREVAGLDFAAAADHWQSIGDTGYEMLKTWAENAYEPGKFVTIPGDERNPKHWHGHENIYFRDMDYFMASKVHCSDESSSITREAWPEFDPERAMLIPHHTGISFGKLPQGNGNAIDINAFDTEGLLSTVEIYSHHGQSETYAPQHILAYEFNRMRNPERRANTSVPGPHYAQDYWMQGKKLGVIASSDEHSGRGGMRHGGVAAVYAETLTREGIFDAIRARKSYATTGEHILLEFNINKASMGETLKVPKDKPMEISLKVWGTDILLRVEILRYRFGLDKAFVPILSVPPRPESMDAEYTFEKTITHDSVYYARIIQEPLNWPAMAWSTPIWIETE